jgi:hypothetical protein
MPPYPGGTRWAAGDPEVQQRWDEWEAADERWTEEHDDGPQHPTDHCWVEYMIAEGDYEPEYYLRSMPKGHVIDGPMQVQVGRVGYGEEAEPVFRLWDDNESGDERR